jgi:hypothetical protein
MHGRGYIATQLPLEFTDRFLMTLAGCGGKEFDPRRIHLLDQVSSLIEPRILRRVVLGNGGLNLFPKSQAGLHLAAQPEAKFVDHAQVLGPCHSHREP